MCDEFEAAYGQTCSSGAGREVVAFAGRGDL
jgi:hypothetical protein